MVGTTNYPPWQRNTTQSTVRINRERGGYTRYGHARTSHALNATSTSTIGLVPSSPLRGMTRCLFW